ncbi:MAG: hypothetical protein AAFY39_09250 [Pseudomonadota bacterium]
MRLVFLLYFAMTTYASAQGLGGFVNGWLDRCYAHSNYLFSVARDGPSEVEKQERSRANLSRYRCASGILTVCEFSDDEVGCLRSATTWLNKRRVAVLQKMPADLRGGSRLQVRYRTFLNSGGTDMAGLLPDCGEAKGHDRLTRGGPAPFTAKQCDAYVAGHRLNRTLYWQRLAEKVRSRR